MRLSKAWLIALRDFKTFSHQRYIWYSLIIFPVLISIMVPGIFILAQSRTPGGIPAARIPSLLDAFSMFLVMGAGVVPSAIASYTIVGEKVEKSLEPLLATPITDGEILIGKTISAFLPTLIAMYTGGIIFMLGTNVVTYEALGYAYFPNLNIAIILFIVMPAAIAMSVEFSVIVSSRVNDVRSANSTAAVMFFPFLIIYIASNLQIITLETDTFLEIAGIIFLVDVVLYFISTKLFKREEILTRWK
jgi:ABC-2 type transport system permease protein